MTVEERLSGLEKRFGAIFAGLLVLIVALAGISGYQAIKLHQLENVKSLRVKELRVYDDKGVDRVVIAGNLPPATLNGKIRKAAPRPMGGILIYDASGTERGGYATADGYANAMLTLDSGPEADGRQVMLLLAEPGGGAFFRQWYGTGSVTMGVNDKPFLTVMDGKDVVFAKPEDNVWTKRGPR
ncbi:MAG: hypothetical protein QM647_00960 [Asticcacaulis sp.]|uniref:hypothetical protein n=1 Tax=Asticcacaulis sp. TaxID=1872648 RepID=UPI0039E5C3AF